MENLIIIKKQTAHVSFENVAKFKYFRMAVID